ncbi:3-oxoacyl-ACP reductase family protein [Saccharomonospora sp. NPDC006951]
MTTLLEGRAALITGAGRGIGAAIATRLATEGARVAVNDLDEEAATATVDRIRSAGGQAIVVPGDIADADKAREIVAVAAEGLAGLDILVNNAGLVYRLPFREFTERHWDRVLSVNLKAPFVLSQAAVDHLAAGGHGAIINICSVAVIGFFRQIAYDASKGGLLSLTRSLAVELGREGIRANAIAPGFIDTDIGQTGDLDRIGQKTVATLPLARMGQPDDIAGAAAWLASDQAGYVTGQVMFVDGGWVRN